MQSMVLDPAERFDDPRPGDYEEFCDDVSGEALPPDLVREARKEEIKFMQDWNVWEVRTIEECKRVTGKAPIGGRWVDHNKGDADSPKIRCRYVAKDIARWRDDAMFAATPRLRLFGFSSQIWPLGAGRGTAERRASARRW